MSKYKSLVLLSYFILWILSLFTIAWLWNRWMLDGPHGPYRWIGMDFAPFWTGVREMFHGANPYSAETTLKIQDTVYGGPAMGEDPMMFVYPAWLFILIAPFSLMPYKWAVILFAGTLLWAMFIFFYMLAESLGNKNLLKQVIWFILLTIGSLPFLVISVTKGQLGYLSLLALAMAYQFRNTKPIVAGIFLGIALIKPTVCVIPISVFIIWSLLNKNWKLILSFFGFMIALLTSSLMAAGNWFQGYFDMLSIKGGMPTLWSLEILKTPWNILYVCLIIGIFIFSVYLSTRNNRDYWFLSAVLMGISLTPMRWIYDLFLGILILTGRKNPSTIQSIMIGIAILLPWVLVLAPESSRWEAAIIGIPLGWAATLLVLIFTEKSEIVS